MILALVVLQLKSLSEQVARDKTISLSEFLGKALPINNPPLLWLTPTEKLLPNPETRFLKDSIIYQSYWSYLENQIHWHCVKMSWVFLDHVTPKVWFLIWHVASAPYPQYFVPISLWWATIMSPSFWGHNWDKVFTHKSMWPWIFICLFCPQHDSLLNIQILFLTLTQMTNYNFPNLEFVTC